MKSQATEGTPAPLSISEVLQIRNYRFLWLSQIVSNIGDSLTRLALVLLINKLTGGSVTAIAGLMIAAALPAVTIGMVAGAIVDRQPRKKVMISAELLQMVFVLMLVALSFNASPPLWAIYTIAFLASSAGAFFMPARMALIPSIVPENGLMSANSLGQMSRVLFSVLGTALAGLLVGVLGQYTLVFAIDALTFLLSPLLIWRIAVADDVDRQPTTTTAKPSVLADIRDGVAIITQSRVLTGVLLGISITMLGMGAVNVLLPPLIVNQLMVSETWFGAIELSQSAAMILSGMLVATLAARFKATRIFSTALFSLGLVSTSFALVSSVWHLFPILFVIGLLNTPVQATSATILQTRVDRSAMGRVGAALNALIMLASLVSMFASGFLADSFGITSVFIGGGVITMIGALIAMLLFRNAHAAASEDAQLAMSQAA